jgi:hypothetical protein
MPFSTLLKAAIIWTIIAVLAIANGAFREHVLTPAIGARIALPVSGILLSAIVLLVTWCCFRLIAGCKQLTCLLIGLQWVLMTLLFEFAFGHFVANKPWPEIFRVFNFMQGDLFILVLVVSLFSPLLVARIKGAWKQ